MTIEERAKQILLDFPIMEHLPASISGKHHIGETQRQHIELAVNVMEHLCQEFNIQGSNRDLLIGATYLHDIGLYVITEKGKVNLPGWEYYSATGYSRIKELMFIHPIISAAILDKYKIDRINEIKKLVSVHMSHWYPLCPQPKTLSDYLICTADYVASRGNGIFKYEGR
jgi:hypothetical protein